MSSTTSSSTVLVAPERAPVIHPSLFLAGSIEMGKAVDWQADLISSLFATFSSPSDAVTLFNPRRPDWNSDWKQDISCPEFKEQVEWELEHLGKADVVALYLQPGTMSPISLLELGLYAGLNGMGQIGAAQGDRKEGKLVVCCPEGYWRRGNVQVVCSLYGVELVDTLEELVAKVEARLRSAVKARKSEKA